MDGIDWVALPVIVEMLGVSDVDELVRDLIAVREFQSNKRGA